MSTLGFMTNGWFDFNTGSKWVPFIGGGVGSANMDLDITSVGGTARVFNQSDTVLAVQLGTGIGYRVNAKSTLSLSYRVFGTMAPKFGNGTETIEYDYMNHSIMAGVAIKF
ncbi:MAG: outer membrane beta-barrel protein [Proteobacteria bacterium]|nr:outer membrane beta-barrel protein [Pseudomonadota bacterium]